MGETYGLLGHPRQSSAGIHLENRGEASGATMGRQTFRMDERSQMSEVTHDPGHPEYNEGSG